MDLQVQAVDILNKDALETCTERIVLAAIADLLLKIIVAWLSLVSILDSSLFLQLLYAWV